MPDKKCLLIIDLQNDFCSGGTLAVRDAETIIPIINAIMDKFDLILASRDLHPETTIHFQKWPVHCVRGTHGAELHSELNTLGIHHFLEKGTSGEDDGYSDFESTNIVLKDVLEKNSIHKLYVGGLATDYCVRATVLDALKFGFNTYVLTDCIRAVNATPDDGDKALEEMKAHGAVLVTSREL